MDRLKLLSQDKATLQELKDFFKVVLNEEIITKTLKREQTTGYAEAVEIINKSLKRIDDLYREKKRANNLNQNE